MAQSLKVLSTSLLVLFVLVLLYLLFRIFAPFLTPIMWALILTRLFQPMHERLARSVRGRRALSAMLMTLAVMILVVLPVSYITGLAVNETIHAYQATMEWVQAGGLEDLPKQLAKLPFVGTLSQSVLGNLVLAYGVLHGPAGDGSTVFQTIASTVSGLAMNVVEVVTDFLIMLFALFFFFRDSPSLVRTVHQALPIDQKAKTEIIDCVDQTVVAVVRGTLLTAVAQGFVAGVTYWLLGLPFPLLLGALSGFLSLLPVGGTGLVWGPVAVYLLLNGAIWKAIVLVAVGAGIVGLMDNVLHPYLVGTGVDLPLIVLFFASLGGLAYFGFIGLFLGPIVVALAKATFHIFQQNYQRASTST
jgi:predicted PurR-regulated permease PerM